KGRWRGLFLFDHTLIQVFPDHRLYFFTLTFQLRVFIVVHRVLLHRFKDTTENQAISLIK
ncbi:hypothetical protein, partial [Enterobacter hormaechei]|uniref:hypothetical protein n=1 Tax=Enterobacter hormaechei TaxID=158836 RepID=UPI002E2B6568